MHRLPHLLALLAVPAVLSAQAPDPAPLAERFIGMTAVAGYEAPALDSVQALLPGARRDRAGNVVLARGSGPAVLVVCPFDEVGYVVGGVRDDGWLTLRRVGARAPGPFFDQFHEGQRVTLFGRRGALPAVVAVRSVHLSRGRAAAEAPFTVDDAFVDLGAANAADVRRAGVDVLTPVALRKEAWRYGAGLLAGPWAGRRAACAALVAAAGAAPNGRVVVAVAVEQELGQRGLRTLANVAGPFSATLLVDGAPGAAGALPERTDTLLARRLPGLGVVRRLALPARNAGTPVESVSLADVTALRDRIAAWIGGAR
ncbi:MAG TPA: hypothetical protein VFS28_00160 [Gemmatimonadales bacterium]|nr:hypothetical protein [Gemmatimonadales bacterium]